MVEYLYDLIIAIPMAIIIAIANMNRIGLEASSSAVYFCICAVIMIYASERHIRSEARGLVYLIPILGFAGLVAVSDSGSIKDAVISYQWFIWSVLLAIFGLLIARLTAINKWSLRLIAITLIGYMSYALYTNTRIDKLTVSLVMFMLLIFVIAELQYGWKKKGYTEIKGHIVFLSPFIIVPCLVIALSNAPKNPYDWKLFTKLMYIASEKIKGQISLINAGNDDYIEHGIGFSDSNRLVDNLNKNDKDIMDLTYARRAESPMYLRGCIYDTFENQQWITTYSETHNDYLMDTMETIAAIYTYDGDFTSYYMRDVTINVHYNMFNTKYIFLPSKVRLGGERIDDMNLVRTGDNYMFDKQRGYGTTYTFRYYMLNRTNPELHILMEQAGNLDSDIWQNVDTKFFSSYDCDKTYDSYLQYKDRVYQVYLEDIELSPELRAYMDQVYEGAETDIDKLERIEEMLSGYTYTLSPGPLPEDINTASEYLDYFILEKQEGYCSYFATAFILLARAEGIPARYVEGFRVVKGNQNVTTVSSSDSHGWPEAYIEGFGWVNFEPTPGCRRYSGWTPTDPASISSNSVSTSDNNSNVIYSMAHSEGADKEESFEDAEVTQADWKPVAIGIGSFLIVIVLIYVIDRITVNMWYQKLGNEKKHLVIYHRIIKILGSLGYSLGVSETLEELNERIRYIRTPENDGPCIPVSVKEFLVTREEVIYGNKNISDEERVCAEQAYKDILLALKSQKKWFYIRKLIVERIE